jgi:hypothetical protein
LRAKCPLPPFRGQAAGAGIEAGIEVVEDKTRGLVARVTPRDGADETKIGEALGRFTPPWALAG